MRDIPLNPTESHLSHLNPAASHLIPSNPTYPTKIPPNPTYPTESRRIPNQVVLLIHETSSGEVHAANPSMRGGQDEGPRPPVIDLPTDTLGCVLVGLAANRACLPLPLAAF